MSYSSGGCCPVSVGKFSVHITQTRHISDSFTQKEACEKCAKGYKYREFVCVKMLSI
jgi:hypothetical protein